ncbi:MAG: hypothetical protein EBS89_09555 [Proteobacteria bacterium]|nr:hypothetical protein [Pseudomonadota bacterium]
MRDYQKIYRFSNGYGASVVRNRMSYGAEKGLYELAVLKGDDLCYSTPITHDVLGWLDVKSVRKILSDIRDLPAAS